MVNNIPDKTKIYREISFKLLIRGKISLHLSVYGDLMLYDSFGGEIDHQPEKEHCEITGDNIYDP